MGVGDWRVCTLATGQCNESVSVAAVLGSTDTQQRKEVSDSSQQCCVLEHCMDSLKLIIHVLGEYAEELVGLVGQILFGSSWLCLTETEMLVYCCM
jgi:hypothetical protein